MSLVVRYRFVRCNQACLESLDLITGRPSTFSLAVFYIIKSDQSPSKHQSNVDVGSEKEPHYIKLSEPATTQQTTYKDWQNINGWYNQNHHILHNDLRMEIKLSDQRLVDHKIVGIVTIVTCKVQQAINGWEISS